MKYTVKGNKNNSSYCLIEVVTKAGLNIVYCPCMQHWEIMLLYVLVFWDKYSNKGKGYGV